jgi:hypothetical protein
MQCLSGTRSRQSPIQTTQTPIPRQPRRSNAATHHGRYCHIPIASEPQTWPKAVPQQREANEDAMNPLPQSHRIRGPRAKPLAAILDTVFCQPLAVGKGPGGTPAGPPPAGGGFAPPPKLHVCCSTLHLCAPRPCKSKQSRGWACRKCQGAARAPQIRAQYATITGMGPGSRQNFRTSFNN